MKIILETKNRHSTKDQTSPSTQSQDREQSTIESCLKSELEIMNNNDVSNYFHRGVKSNEDAEENFQNERDLPEKECASEDHEGKHESALESTEQESPLSQVAIGGKESIGNDNNHHHLVKESCSIGNGNQISNTKFDPDLTSECNRVIQAKESKVKALSLEKASKDSEDYVYVKTPFPKENLINHKKGFSQKAGYCVKLNTQGCQSNSQVNSNENTGSQGEKVLLKKSALVVNGEFLVAEEVLLNREGNSIFNKDLISQNLDITNNKRINKENKTGNNNQFNTNLPLMSSSIMLNQVQGNLLCATNSYYHSEKSTARDCFQQQGMFEESSFHEEEVNVKSPPPSNNTLFFKSNEVFNSSSINFNELNEKIILGNNYNNIDSSCSGNNHDISLTLPLHRNNINIVENHDFSNLIKTNLTDFNTKESSAHILRKHVGISNIFSNKKALPAKNQINTQLRLNEEHPANFNADHQTKLFDEIPITTTNNNKNITQTEENVELPPHQRKKSNRGRKRKILTSSRGVTESHIFEEDRGSYQSGGNISFKSLSNQVNSSSKTLKSSLSNNRFCINLENFECLNNPSEANNTTIPSKFNPENTSEGSRSPIKQNDIIEVFDSKDGKYKQARVLRITEAESNDSIAVEDSLVESTTQSKDNNTITNTLLKQKSQSQALCNELLTKFLNEADLTKKFYVHFLNFEKRMDNWIQAANVVRKVPSSNTEPTSGILSTQKLGKIASKSGILLGKHNNNLIPGKHNESKTFMLTRKRSNLNGPVEEQVSVSSLI